jgi:hypothetical protein
MFGSVRNELKENSTMRGFRSGTLSKHHYSDEIKKDAWEKLSAYKILTENPEVKTLRGSSRLRYYYIGF